MATSNRRFSKQDLLQIFVYCSFPIHVWTIVNMLYDLPAWVVYMNIVELFSIVAYTLTFALVETFLVVLLVILIGNLVPRRWSQTWFIPFSSILIIESAVLAIVLHELIQTQAFSKWYAVSGFALLAMVSLVIVIRWKRLGHVLRSIGDRLAVLTSVYIAIDLLGLIVVLVRNIVSH